MPQVEFKDDKIRTKRASCFMMSDVDKVIDYAIQKATEFDTPEDFWRRLYSEVASKVRESEAATLVGGGEGK